MFVAVVKLVKLLKRPPAQPLPTPWNPPWLAQPLQAHAPPMERGDKS
jgi:hypothetical protein